MATERLKEFRDWLNLIFTILSLAVIPVCWLAFQNQRLLIMETIRHEYVSFDVYKAETVRLSAENTSLKAEITVVNSKLDRIQTQLIRLTDAVKLKDPP